MNHFDILELEEDAQKIFKDILKLKTTFYRMTKTKTGDYDMSELDCLREDLESIVNDWQEYVIEPLELTRKENWRAMRESIRA